MAASKPTNIDYAGAYFQIPKLTTIHGEPDFNTLRILRDELNANAGSITTTLGGVFLGTLAALAFLPLLMPSEAKKLFCEAFVRPIFS